MNEHHTSYLNISSGAGIHIAQQNEKYQTTTRKLTPNNTSWITINNNVTNW